MLAWPARLRLFWQTPAARSPDGRPRIALRRFTAAIGADPLLRPSLFAVWLAVLLAWLVDDSGVSLAAAALPVALPLAIVLVVRTDKPTAGGQASDRRANVWPDRAIAK